jgi:hypothetical protein
MNIKPTWNINETRNHILRIYGEEQLEVARVSLNSVILRQQYARYHYHEANKIIDRFLKKEFKTKHAVEILLDNSYQKNLALIKLEANILACLSNMHAIADIYSYAIYYTFGFNLTDKLAEHKIVTNSVLNIIKNKLEFNTIHQLLNDIKNEGDFGHLSAIVNSSKHRGIKRLKLSFSQLGMPHEPYSIKIPSYDYNNKNFPEVEAKVFLASEFNRATKLQIYMGNAINEILAEI